MIRKRADGRWEGRYTLGFNPKTGKPRRKSIYGKTQQEVRKKLSRIIVDIDEGTYVEPNSMKLGTWLDIWLKEYTKNIKPATHSAYEQHVRVHVKPYLGQVKLKQLTPHMVQATYNELLEKRKLSPKSIKKHPRRFAQGAFAGAEAGIYPC